VDAGWSVALQTRELDPRTNAPSLFYRIGSMPVHSAGTATVTSRASVQRCQLVFNSDEAAVEKSRIVGSRSEGRSSASGSRLGTRSSTFSRRRSNLAKGMSAQRRLRRHRRGMHLFLNSAAGEGTTESPAAA